MKDRYELKEHMGNNVEMPYEPDILDTENNILYNSQLDLDLICELLNEQNRQISILLTALDLACDELNDAKSMLRSVRQDDFASLLNDSSDYFRKKAEYSSGGRK